MAFDYTKKITNPVDFPTVPGSEQEIRTDMQGMFDEIKGAHNSHLADVATHIKPVRFIIGSSTSNWTKKDCHYLCDGIADDTEIKEAIAALPMGGGEIVILDGTYNITSEIVIEKNNVTILGNGNATILNRSFENIVDVNGVISIVDAEYCKIQNLKIYGNKSIYTAPKNSSIFIDGSSNNIIVGNTCVNNSLQGIYLRYDSTDNIITNNICMDSERGVYFYSGNSNNFITNNICNDNNKEGIGFFENNTNNVLIGNACKNNLANGIYTYRKNNNNTITGNNCMNNEQNGILINNSSNNIVTGNICIRGTGLITDYDVTQNTIKIVGTTLSVGNLVAVNLCMGKAPLKDQSNTSSLWGNKYDNDNDLPI